MYRHLLTTLTLLFAASTPAQPQPHLHYVRQQIEQELQDPFERRSALHLARWYSLLSYPLDNNTISAEFREHLTGAASEALQCIRFASPRYAATFKVQSSLPSIAARQAESFVIHWVFALIHDELHTDEQHTMLRQNTNWRPAPGWHVDMRSEEGCLGRAFLPHLNWLTTHHPYGRNIRIDAATLMPYEKKTDHLQQETLNSGEGGLP